MSDQYLGEIRMFAGNFAPQGWALCNGQLLSIAQNTALFSLLGTYYGGNGVSTFALPNLQGRVAIHQGNGTGLSPYTLGQMGGTETVGLNINNMPAHTHALNASNTTGTQSSPAGSSIAPINTGTPREPQLALGFAPGTPGAPMAAGSVGSAGGSQPFSTVPPYLALTFIIALTGIYPPRS